MEERKAAPKGPLGNGNNNQAASAPRILVILDNAGTNKDADGRQNQRTQDARLRYSFRRSLRSARCSELPLYYRVITHPARPSQPELGLYRKSDYAESHASTSFREREYGTGVDPATTLLVVTSISM